MSFGRRLNEEEKRLIKEAARIIDNRFDWATTEEGYPFWEGVSKKLHRIAGQREVCDSCGQTLPDAQ